MFSVPPDSKSRLFGQVYDVRVGLTQSQLIVVKYVRSDTPSCQGSLRQCLEFSASLLEYFAGTIYYRVVAQGLSEFLE